MVRNLPFKRDIIMHNIQKHKAPIKTFRFRYSESETSKLEMSVIYQYSGCVKVSAEQSKLFCTRKQLFSETSEALHQAKNNNSYQSEKKLEIV